MPNREQGFYKAWKEIVPYDPALNHHLRKQLKHLPEDAEHALRDMLIDLKVPESQRQDYLEADLLALPGWAGMMLWRSQQSTQEEKLLLEYLAVRVSMEYAMVQSFLPTTHLKKMRKYLLSHCYSIGLDGAICKFLIGQN